MNLFTLLFSFRGRINRAKYWLAVLIYVIFLSILWGIIYWYELEGGALIVLAASGTEDILSLLLSTASVALGIWAIVELGFLRGTSGPNRYGPDPLATAAA